MLELIFPGIAAKRIIKVALGAVADADLSVLPAGPIHILLPATPLHRAEHAS